MDVQSKLDERLDVHATVAVLLRNWPILLTLTLSFAIAGLCASFIYPKHYEVSIKLVPSTSQSTSDRLASIAGSLGGGLGGVSSLMSLAGISSSSSSERAEALATLQSEVLTERYIAENDLLPILFKKYWDAAGHRWTTSDPDKLPTLWKGNRLFVRKIRTVSDDVGAGIVTLTINWTNPAQAAKWANGIVSLTNQYLRTKAIAESERGIAYLNQQVSKTNDVELKDALYALMENEIKQEMLARGDDEYAFKVVDPATQPEIAAYPKPVLWSALAAVGGLILGAVVALYRRPA